MEMKVWMDGYQRVVCGVTDQTTCQDVMIALAHASGKTGRFTMFEKWRTNERCLSPTDFPLLILQKWGEYSSDVQLILRHTSVGSGKKHRTQPTSGRLRPASSPPEHAPVKKSLTFSGAHRRMSSTEQPAASNGRVEGGSWNVCHSVESSEQSSIASQSSASLSPYMSLERQTQKNDKTLLNGDFEKDSHLRHIWLPDHLKQNSDDRTLFANTPTEEKSSKAAIPSSQNPFPGVSRSQPPVPSARSSKTTASNTEVKSQIQKPAQRKEALPSEIKQQNRNIELEREHFQSRAAVSSNARISNSSVCSNKPTTLKAIDSSKAPISSKPDSSKTPITLKPDSSKTPITLKPDSSKTPITSKPDSSKTPITSKPDSSKTPVSLKPSIPSNVSSNRPIARDKNENLVTNSEPKVCPSKLAIVKQTIFSKSSEERNSPRNETEKLKQAKEISGNEPGLRRVPPVAAKRQRPVTVNSEGVTHLRTDSDSTVTPSVEPVVTSRPPVKQTSGLEDPERMKEAQQKKELIELIGRQEREMLKCESHLKDLNHEISLLEGDLEVDETELESQMHKIEELEAVEKQLEEEILEMELVSWEDKLILEKQRENQIRTEILLLQSSIAKSEKEILSFVEKIQSLTTKTEEATQELNRFLEEKKEKENKEIEDLESSLHQAAIASEASVSALKSLEQEIVASDRSLSKKKEELAELEGQLRKLNLELFLQEPREIVSTRRSRTPVLERLGLSRPGSSHRLQRCQLSPSPLRLNQTIDETNRPALGYIV